ncbi:hypothetical protein GE09DRAFT_1161978 [Coniochaeta sp. 2T2.1]|nr:hypothetical protein GE09DRAFT_1161978 [Coniochaeta sp. 2T2.1]
MGLEDGDGWSKNPISICNGLHWHATEDLFRPCRCGKAGIGRTKAKHSDDVAQVLAPSRVIFRKSPADTVSSVELKDGGAVLFGYSSFLGLKWPDVGSPEEGGILLETHEEASDYRDSALGTSPALTTTDGCTSEAQAVWQPDRTAEAPASSPAGTGPLDSTVTGTVGACEPEEHVVETPLPGGQKSLRHDPAQVARGQAGTDSRDRSKRKNGARTSGLRKRVRECLRSVFARAKPATGIRVRLKALFHY